MPSEFIRRHVIGLVAICIALTGTAYAATPNGPGAGSGKAVSAQKFKKLKQRVSALEDQLGSPATGDVTGTYPNLKIADNAVTTGKIADNAVTTGKIGDGAITDPKLGTASVGARVLGQVTYRTGSPISVAANSADVVTTNTVCSAGEEDLSGSGAWLSNLTDPKLAVSSEFGLVNNLVYGANDSGTARNFSPTAFCLAP